MLAALVLIGLLKAVPASAIACTVGLDTNLDYDRNPSECVRIPISGFAAGPITTGPDGRPWFLVHDGGALYPATLSASETARRLPSQLPPGPTPTSLTLGADGGLWYAGAGRYGRIDLNGNVQDFSAPGLGLASAARGINPALLANSAVQPTYGAVTDPDGTVWIAGGASVRRYGTDGSVRTFGLPGGRPADRSLAVATDGAVWYVSVGGGGVGRLDTGSGDVRFWDTSGTPRDIVAGPGRNVVWMTLSYPNGRDGVIHRISTAAFPARSFRCPNQNPAACIRARPTPLGDYRRFDAHYGPSGITATPDGNLYYAEGPYIGRITAFRGNLPCYDRVTRGHDFGCGHSRSRVAQVTYSGYAYVHTSCPHMTLEYCKGTVELRTPGGRTLGRSFFVESSYDNVRLRVPVGRSVYRQLRRGRRVPAIAVYRSEDLAGNQRINYASWTLALTG